MFMGRSVSTPKKKVSKKEFPLPKKKRREAISSDGLTP
jgi:hypothetical protein